MSDLTPTDQTLVDAVRLMLVSGIGPRLQQLLIARFGSPAAVFRATADELRAVDGIGPKILSAIGESRHSDAAEQEVARCRELGVDLLHVDDAGYPPMLAEISDAPHVLYCRGDIVQQDQLAVAIVGSRRCTLCRPGNWWSRAALSKY